MKYGKSQFLLLVAVLALVAVPGAIAKPKGSPVVGSLSGLDRHFVVASNQANWFAIVGGVMAKNRSVSSLGRTAGQQIADQDRQLETGLASLAARLRVKLPNQISAPDHWSLHAAGTLYGTTFDQQYAQLAIAHGSSAIVAAQEELRYGANARVRAYARDLLPTLKEQLKLANQLARSGQ